MLASADDDDEAGLHQLGVWVQYPNAESTKNFETRRPVLVVVTQPVELRSAARSASSRQRNQVFFTSVSKHESFWEDGVLFLERSKKVT